MSATAPGKAWPDERGGLVTFAQTIGYPTRGQVGIIGQSRFLLAEEGVFASV